jgi:hypothetical protein
MAQFSFDMQAQLKSAFGWTRPHSELVSCDTVVSFTTAGSSHQRFVDISFSFGYFVTVSFHFLQQTYLHIHRDSCSCYLDSLCGSLFLFAICVLYVRSYTTELFVLFSSLRLFPDGVCHLCWLNQLCFMTPVPTYPNRCTTRPSLEGPTADEHTEYTPHLKIK